MRFIEEQLIISSDEQIKKISENVVGGELITDGHAHYL